MQPTAAAPRRRPGLAWAPLPAAGRQLALTRPEAEPLPLGPPGAAVAAAESRRCRRRQGPSQVEVEPDEADSSCCSFRHYAA